MPVESLLNTHIAEEMAHLFSATDATSTEDEYLSVLTAIVRATKPRRAIETGTYTGCGTRAIVAGMKANDFGLLITIDREVRQDAEYGDDTARLDSHVAVVRGESLKVLGHWPKTEPFDFAFLDSDLPTRADELALLIERNLLTPAAIVAIHDTGRCRTVKDGSIDPESAEFWSRLERNVIRKHRPRAVLEFPLSRGLTLIQV